MRTLALAATLFAFYCALSGQFHNAYLMKAGVVACLAIALLSRHMGTDDDEGFPIRYWVKTAAYLPWLNEFRAFNLNGESGALNISQDGRIHRELAWGVVSRGQLQPLPRVSVAPARRVQAGPTRKTPTQQAGR